MTAGVYAIVNMVNGTRYIGSTKKSAAHRFMTHRRLLRSGKHPNHSLQAAWVEHGEDAFIIEALESVDPDDRLLEIAEGRWIKHFSELREGALYNKDVHGRRWGQLIPDVCVRGHSDWGPKVNNRRRCLTCTREAARSPRQRALSRERDRQRVRPPKTTLPREKTCPVCATVFSGTGKAIYDSDACERVERARKRRERSTKVAFETRTCAQCGVSFQSQRQAVYCSSPCNSMAWRSRRRRTQQEGQEQA